MKWLSRSIHEGNVRTRRIFALIPRRCQDGYTRWLEHVIVTEYYNEIIEEWREFSVTSETSEYII